MTDYPIDSDDGDELETGPDETGDRLWRAAMRDVKPLRRERRERRPGVSHEKPLSKDMKPAGPQIRERVIEASIPVKSRQGRGLDARTHERLRRGHMAIEARLDLHGMTQEKAHKSLNRFIKNAYSSGFRCVLVITGKGQMIRTDDPDWWVAPRGVLRDAVPGWLAAAGIREMILEVLPAQPKDGGTGALYVLLRRHREP